jgi:hypothetical protein
MKVTVTMTHIALGTFNVEMTIALVFHHQQLTAVIYQQQLHLLLATMMFLHPLVILLHLDGQMIIHSTVINMGT